MLAALGLSPALPTAALAQSYPATPPPVAGPAAAAAQLKPEQYDVLRQALDQADTHGFDPGAFSIPDLEARLASADPAVRQAAETQLVTQVLRYAKAVHAGRLAEGAFAEDWGLRPAAYDPAPDFARAAAQDQLKAWLDSLPPPYTGYDGLMQGLQVYREIAAKGGWKPVSSGPPLKPGAKDDRVTELRARLAAEDPMVKAEGDDVYDPMLVQAVMRAQKRYGLRDDGIVAGQTLDALNVPVEDRVGQIIANMERWRWLPPVLPTDRIQVNVAAAILTVFHADTPVMSMRAVTGRPGDETPMLSSKIESIVLNPPWNVPSTIAARELFPKEKAHPGYFASHDFVVVQTEDGGQRLVQKAGNQSALGKVKFDFANPYGVYLHDTPSRGLFSGYDRLDSHGCVRLQRPIDLAKLVMQGDPTWTPEALDAAIATGKTQRVALPQPISVYLLYWTAYMGADGMMNFRDDPYGWDADLMTLLKGGKLPDRNSD